MYPPRFDYVAPDSFDEVLELVAEHGDEVKVIAGGQSLIPMLKLRFASPATLIDLNRLSGTDGLARIDESDRGLRIGAMARHNQLAGATQLSKRYAVVTSAAPLVADPLIRNLGTIGGSVAHADPAGDWGSVLLALDATVVARSTSGTRRLAARDFFKGVFWTELEETELITAFEVPRPAGPTGGVYLKLERKVGDFATAAVAVHLEMANGAIGKAGIGLTAVGPKNIKATDAEAALAGQAPSQQLFEHAADLAAQACSPGADVRGSVEFKRNVVRVFVKRGLQQALEMARA